MERLLLQQVLERLAEDLLPAEAAAPTAATRSLRLSYAAGLCTQRDCIHAVRKRLLAQRFRPTGGPPN